METRLNFINKTDNTRNARYVVFRKNVAEENGDAVMVLKFIDDIGFGESVSFTLKDERWVAGWWTSYDEQENQIIWSDSLSEPVSIESGDRKELAFYSVDITEGIKINEAGYAGNRHEIEIINNDHSDKAIHGQVYQSREVNSTKMEGGEWVPTSYRPAELLASHLLEPGQQARFRFDDNLCLGVTWYRSGNPNYPGTHIIPAEEVYHIAELPLPGITSADIIATGGGPDDQRLTVNFGLDNVRRE